MSPRFAGVLVCAGSLAALAGCASAPEVISISPDTYTIVVTDPAGTLAKPSAMKAEAFRRANAFAARQGKVVIPLTTNLSLPVPGFPEFELQFRVLDENDPQTKRAAVALHAQRATGIGGVFFRADNPPALARWYKDNLGIDPVPSDYSQMPWVQEAGPTVFAPFPKDSDFFGSSNKCWMLNFRVKNLDAMVAQLRSSHVDVTVDPKTYPNGRFAQLHDPDGNPVELWEPQANE
jgi:glyoxylase I family protein